MSDTPDQPLQSPQVSNAGDPAVPSTINMPDHWVRQTASFQVYVRLARPTLDWVTVGAVAWCLIAEPWIFRQFNALEAGLSLTWAATVYGFKFAEKIKGVA